MTKMKFSSDDLSLLTKTIYALNTFQISDRPKGVTYFTREVAIFFFFVKYFARNIVLDEGYSNTANRLRCLKTKRARKTLPSSAVGNRTFGVRVRWVPAYKLQRVIYYTWMFPFIIFCLYILYDYVLKWVIGSTRAKIWRGLKPKNLYVQNIFFLCTWSYFEVLGSYTCFWGAYPSPPAPLIASMKWVLSGWIFCALRLWEKN